jgi:hypothetical protein
MKPYDFPSKTTPFAVKLPKGPDDKRKTRYFKSRAAAAQFCRDSKGKTINELLGLPTQTEIKRALTMQEEEQRKALEFYREHKAGLIPITVREAVDEWLLMKVAEVKRGNLKMSTVDSDRYRLHPYLVAAYGEHQLSDITSGVLHRFFEEIAISRASINKSLRPFFKWAKRRGYLNINPMDGYECPDRIGQNKEYYPIDVFGRMLRVAGGFEAPKKGKSPTRDFIGLLPWFVLSGFCGLRSSEAFRQLRKADAIRWADVHFDWNPPFIRIREEVAKTTRRKSGNARRITSPLFLDAAKAWLEYCPRQSETVCPWTKRKIQDLKRKFRRATGIEFADNAFRNSCMTYAANAGIGLSDLAKEMGDSEASARRYYVDLDVHPGEGVKWFNLRPFEVVLAKSEKIISLAV